MLGHRDKDAHIGMCAATVSIMLKSNLAAHVYIHSSVLKYKLQQSLLRDTKEPFVKKYQVELSSAWKGHQHMVGDKNKFLSKNESVFECMWREKKVCVCLHACVC